jgi:hypothetical protein
MAVLLRLLRRLLRRPAVVPGLPPHARALPDGDGWVREPRGDGVGRHHPASPTPAQLGLPACDLLHPPGHLHQRRPLTPSQVLRQAAAQRRHDGSWDR